LFLFLFWELFCLVLPPVGVGAATTGAGADVVVTGAEFVVAGAALVVAGAALVVAGAELAAAGLAFCTVAFLCVALCAAGFLALTVVVWAAGCVCGVAAAGVELDCELDVPPQPATTRAAVIVLSSALFIVPAPWSLLRACSSGYKTPGTPQRCAG
jgi:hypothetical protein